MAPLSFFAKRSAPKGAFGDAAEAGVHCSPPNSRLQELHLRTGKVGLSVVSFAYALDEC
jgi:hypothetical protein